MKPRRHTFFFARLTLAGPWEDKKSATEAALQTDVAEERGRFKYGFFDYQPLYLDDTRFAFGRIVKYKQILEGEVVDEQSHRIVERGLPRGIVAKSDFLLHSATGLLAYRPVASRLSAHQFRSIFAALLEAAHHAFFVSAHIDPVNEDITIMDAISRFTKISRVEFDLHPSNPSNRPFYRPLDQRLKAINASRMQQTIFGAEGGLRPDKLKNDDALRGVLMAADGYGEASVDGEIDNRRLVVTTGDAPVRADVEPSDEPENLGRQLLSAFERLWKRMSE